MCLPQSCAQLRIPGFDSTFAHWKSISAVHFCQCQQQYNKKGILIILPLFRDTLEVILPFLWNFKVIIDCDTLCSIILGAHLFTISPKPKRRHHTSLPRVIRPCLPCSNAPNEKCRSYSLLNCSEMVVSIKKITVLIILLRILP